MSDFLVVACPAGEKLTRAEDGRLLAKSHDHLAARHAAYAIHRGLLDREGRAPRIEIWCDGTLMGHTGAKTKADREQGWGMPRKKGTSRAKPWAS